MNQDKARRIQNFHMVYINRYIASAKWDKSVRNSFRGNLIWQMNIKEEIERLRKEWKLFIWRCC